LKKKFATTIDTPESPYVARSIPVSHDTSVSSEIFDELIEFANRFDPFIIPLKLIQEFKELLDKLKTTPQENLIEQLKEATNSKKLKQYAHNCSINLEKLKNFSIKSSPIKSLWDTSRYLFKQVLQDFKMIYKTYITYPKTHKEHYDAIINFLEECLPLLNELPIPQNRTLVDTFGSSALLLVPSSLPSSPLTPIGPGWTP